MQIQSHRLELVIQDVALEAQGLHACGGTMQARRKLAEAGVAWQEHRHIGVLAVQLTRLLCWPCPEAPGGQLYAVLDVSAHQAVTVLHAVQVDAR